MSDMKILEKDGWHELDDVRNGMDANVLDIGALWRAAGQGDVEAARELLVDGGWSFDVKLEGVKVVAVPDDFLGDSYRVWVKHK